MTTIESNIIDDLTPVEVANFLAKLEEGRQAALLSTREAKWNSAEYESRFQNAAELDGVVRDIIRETIDNGMRRPGEPVEEFAERVGSEARLAEMRRADPEFHSDAIIPQTDIGMPPERAKDSQREVANRLPNDPRTSEIQAYTRAFSDTAATYVRRLRERDPLPEPDRTPGNLHPDPFLPGRGWHVNEHGTYIRRAQPEPQVPLEHEPEAG